MTHVKEWTAILTLKRKKPASPIGRVRFKHFPLELRRATHHDKYILVRTDAEKLPTIAHGTLLWLAERFEGIVARNNLRSDDDDLHQR